MLNWKLTWKIIPCVLLVGCSIPIRIVFNESDTSWHYSIDSPRLNGPVVVVIDTDTLEREYAFRVFISGIRDWTPQIGKMLAQISDVEFPQMFDDYTQAQAYEHSGTGPRPLVLKLDVIDYRFANAQATLTLHAVFFDQTGRTLLEQRYTESGSIQKKKMRYDISIPSAVRQSSLSAFKATFRNLRRDLNDALLEPNVARQMTHSR